MLKASEIEMQALIKSCTFCRELVQNQMKNKKVTDVCIVDN